jgi:hypothetical protein
MGRDATYRRKRALASPYSRAMTSREARLTSPKLLPGIAAGTWARVVRWAWIVSGVLFVVGFVFESFGPLRHVLPFPGFDLIVPSTLVFIVLRIGALASLPNEKAEVRVGYTTLPNKYANLEQLDPKTGAVLRAAGEPYLRKSGRDRDGDLTRLVSRTPRPSILGRIAPTLIGTVVSAVFLIVIYFVFGLLNNGRLTVIFILLPSIVVLCAIAYGIGSMGVRRTLLRLRAQAPTEFAFVFGSSPGVGSALQALVPVDETPDHELTRSRQATASASGITFWKGNPPHQVAKLPWSKVISVQQDTIRVGRSAYPSVLITYRDMEAEEVVALPLANAEANYLAIHTVAEARWIASELNQLRTSTTAARLI